MKEIFLPLAGVAIFIILVGLLTKHLQTFPNPSEVNQNTAPQKELKIKDTKISVEIADTPDKRKLGLSGRDRLDKTSGMFFSFDKKGVFPSFWMKDMKFSLDIIWISDGRIVKIDKNIQPPAPGTPDSKLPLYYPDHPIDYVLEANAGFSDSKNLKVGDFVQGDFL